MDLVHADHVAIDLDLPATGSRTHRASVPPGHDLVFTLTHTGGAIGRMTLALYDQRHPDIPVSNDSMTCAEPGCTFSVVVAKATEPRTLIATCSATIAMKARLEVTRRP